MIYKNKVTFFIEAKSFVSQVPVAGNIPDFSGIKEPTLSILQAAWEAGKDNIEIIPDPEPIPEAKIPDWQGFGYSVSQNPSLFLLLESSPKFYLIYSYFPLFANNFNESLVLAFIATWEIFRTTITWSETTITELNTLLIAFNIPMQLNNNGSININN